MKKFERSDEYLTKLFLSSLDNHVIQDARVEIIYSTQHHKLKAYCPASDTYLQFPTRLRRAGRRFIADVVKAKKDTGTIFYRAYPGSIRDAVTGELLA